jgi:hypothetical protein
LLVDEPETREALRLLEVQYEDLTADLLREGELEAARRERRLSSLKWKGAALLRLPVEAGGFKGELALADDDAKAEVLLAREGVAVAPWSADFPSGLGGVLDHPSMPVDAEWKTARPTAEMKATLAAEVDRLFAAMAREVQNWSEEKRAVALRHALRWLAWKGVRAPEHLDGLGPVGDALAAAPFFPMLGGGWLDLRTLIAEVLRAGRVPVFVKSFFAPDTMGELALQATRLDAPWLDALDGAFGRKIVDRVRDAKAWKLARAEADPPSGTPLLEGLNRLRKETRLLRAGVLGHLTPDDLIDVKLVKASGREPVRYDVKRKLALLDSETPEVVRALEQWRTHPERVFVLLASIYGAVNRALDRVTDEHEAQLLLALAAHLGENPERLHARGAEGDKT